MSQNCPVGQVGVSQHTPPTQEPDAHWLSTQHPKPGPQMIPPRALMIRTLDDPSSAIAISVRPSPLKSPVTMPWGLLPTVTWLANTKVPSPCPPNAWTRPEVAVTPTPGCGCVDTVISRSLNPSPSKSAAAK